MPKKPQKRQKSLLSKTTQNSLQKQKKPVPAQETGFFSRKNED